MNKDEQIELLTERLRLANDLLSDTMVSMRNVMTLPLQEELSLCKDLTDLDEDLEEVVSKIKLASAPDHLEDTILISCDASITKNPGGIVSIGFVIRFPPEDGVKTIKISKRTPSSTNNEGEYDAIYEALLFLFNTQNRPAHEILIRSDSKLVVKQLLGEWENNTPALQRKAEAIHELIAAGPVPVRIEWHKRNSTKDLEQANFLAQDELGIKRH